MLFNTEKSRWAWLLGALLILGGFVMLLGNLNVLSLGPVFWVGAFIVAGGVFLAVFVRDQAQWWALIPGMALLGVALTIAATEFTPAGSLLHESAGAMLLYFIGLSFGLIYLRDTKQWWPMIPMGALFSVATTALLASMSLLSGEALGGVLFLGMALTFALIAVLPSPKGRMVWALIPAAVLGVMGVLITGQFTTLLVFLWPIVLIVGGFILLLVNFWRERGSH